MATIDVNVPDIGDFTVVRVLVKPGDAIKVDELLVELESDKATKDVPSPIAGRVADVRTKVGDKVSRGVLIARIDVNIPLQSSQNGNLFKDAVDPKIVWYLPSIDLAVGTEQTFQFAVTRTGEDAQDNPINRCRMTIAFKKTEPNDVAAFRAANPLLEVREIPPIVNHETNSTEAAFTSPFVAGGQLMPKEDGLLLLTIDTIVGQNVTSMYDALNFTGSAKISVIYFYVVMSPNGPIKSFSGSLLHTSVLLGKTLAAQQFPLAYTITVGTTTQLIFSVDDLLSLNPNQSAFEKLTALGNVNERFPSVSQLFISRLDRGITVIPSRYVILRERGSCAAACQAVVDSASTATGTKFQFSFTLVPDINPIELVQLLAEINARPDTRGSALELPTSFNLATGSTLSTPFAASVRYEAGSGAPNTIALSVEITEQTGGAPAVAIANAFLAQLRNVHEPFLTGSVKLKLDDAFPTRIDIPVLLSFKETQRGNATDEFSVQIDQANAKLTVNSASAFDLFVVRMALLGQQSTTVVPLGQVVRKGQSTSMQLPADHIGLNVLVDCELAIGDDALSISDFFKLLQFRAVDVQDTQYLLAVNAGAVGFQARAIDRIDVAISLTNLPGVLIPSLLLLKERTADSTHALVPIVQAITELNGTLLFTVHFLDPNRAPLVFAQQNNFVQHPIFILNDADLVN